MPLNLFILSVYISYLSLVCVVTRTWDLVPSLYKSSIYCLLSLRKTQESHKFVPIVQYLLVL